MKDLKNRLADYFSLLWPILLRVLFLTLVSIASSILSKGLKDKTAMATLELTRDLVGTPRFLFMGIANILSGIVIEVVPTQRYQQSTEALKASFLMAVIFLLPCTVIFCGFSQPLLRYWEQPEEVVMSTSAYLPIVALTLFPVSFITIVQRYLQGLGETKINTKVTFLQALVSIVLSYVFIYGKFGFPAMGLVGSAMAYLVSLVLTSMICVYQLIQLQQQGKICFSWHTATRLDMAMCKHLLFLGFFLGVSFAVRTAFNGGITMVAGQLDATTQKVYSLVKTFRRLLLVLVFAISIVGRILMNRYQGQPGQQREMAHFSYGLLTAASLFIAVFLYLGGIPFMRWMDKTATPAHLRQCRSVFPLEILYIWIDGLVFLSVSLLSGMKETFFPALITALVSFGLGLPLAEFSNRMRWGLSGIYLAMIFATATSFMAMYARVWYKTVAPLHGHRRANVLGKRYPA